MIRLEIIANKTVESDIYEALLQVGKDVHYSRLDGVHGRGHSDPKKGDAVWPEENFIYIIYTDDDTARKLIGFVSELKERFTREGIRVFAIPFEDPVDI